MLVKYLVLFVAGRFQASVVLDCKELIPFKVGPSFDYEKPADNSLDIFRLTLIFGERCF